MSAVQKPEPGTTVATSTAPRARELAALTTEKARRLIEPLLKGGVTYERILSETYFAIQKNPALLECTADSLIMAVAQCTAWDLEIGVKAHLVPFNVKVKVPDGQGGTKDEWQSRAQAIRDYKGDAELVVRCGAARYVDAHNVYEKELFEYELGTSPFIRHQPIIDPSKRGRLIASYAVAKVNSQDIKIVVMSRDEVDAVRKQFSKQWKKHWVNRQEVEYTLEEILWYGPKTCVHRVVKLLPTSARLATVLKSFDDEERQLIQGAEIGDARIQIAGTPASEPSRQPRLMASGAEGEPYTPDAARTSPQEAVREVAAPRTATQLANAETAASVPDPYEPATGESREPADANTRPEPSDATGNTRREASAVLSGPGAFTMPFTRGGTAIVGVPLAKVTTPDLKKAMGWAMANAQHEDFIEAASRLLDDRRLHDAPEPSAEASK